MDLDTIIFLKQISLNAICFQFNSFRGTLLINFHHKVVFLSYAD